MGGVSAGATPSNGMGVFSFACTLPAGMASVGRCTLPAQGDIAAGKMIFGVDGVDAQRRQQLIDLLEIDLDWRLNKVSDGQRRRVQICMGLLKPYQACSPRISVQGVYTLSVFCRLSID